MWGTSIRIDEALRIKVHIESYIYTHDPLMRSGDFEVNSKNEIYVQIYGKGKRQRKISVPDEAVASINYYLHHRKIKSDILFLPTGKRWQNRYNPITAFAAWYNIQKIFNNIGIKKQKGICTHLLRHTAINTWIDNGEDILKITAQTGHASPAGLEPYFWRRKELTRSLVKSSNPLDIDDFNNKHKKFEKLLLERYVTKNKSKS